MFSQLNIYTTLGNFIFLSLGGPARGKEIHLYVGALEGMVGKIRLYVGAR
jgi:hypothetical protein